MHITALFKGETEIMESNMLGPKDIVDYVKQVGIDKSSKKEMQTLILGIIAGMFIALGGFAAAVASHSITNYGVSKIVAGVMFPVGLVLVLICGAELFTGNTLLAVAYYEKEISIKLLLKNWILVYLGNIIGSLFITELLVWSGALDINGGLFGIYALKVATNKANLSFGQGLSSGILCNILVSIAVWASYASRDVIGKIWVSFIPIMAFVIAGFEHYVANMYYFSIGIIAKGNPSIVKASGISKEKLSNLTFKGIFCNMLPVTLGNIIGGAIIVSGIYWLVFKGFNKQSKIEVTSKRK